jgi:hypothetical protein
MSKEIEILKVLAQDLVDELAEAISRTPITISSWINIKKAYLISLSVHRILQQTGKTDK